MKFGVDLYKDKVAVVVGSTSGIGAAICKAFAEQGAKVVVSGRRQERGDQVVNTIKEQGGEAIFFRVDATNPEELKNLIDGTVKKFGKIDILVNSVAVEMAVLMADATLEDYTKIMDTNLRSYFLATMYALPYMRKQKSGNILNINSITSVQFAPGVGIYSMAKAAIRNMTKAIAFELAQEGIRCNDLNPGLIHAAVYETPEGARHGALGVAATPARRMGTPEECAYAALYLCCDEIAAFTTGAALFVDGGKTLG